MTYRKFISNIPLRRAVVLAGVALILWLARSVMSIILLTFIFAFLCTRLVNAIRRHVHIRPVVVVGPLYLAVLLGLSYAAVHYVPAIIRQSVALFNSVQKFYYSDEFAHNQAMQWVLKNVQSLNLRTQLEGGVKTVLEYASNVGAMGVTLLLAFLLSFFFTVEIDELKRFGNLFIKSPFGWLFADLHYFATKFIDTFGVVIEAQIFIAIVNTVITTVTLLVMKMPNVPSLAIMVFLLSLIPVAGAIISVVPLAIIAFTVDGLQGVITIVIMIIVIHILEAYVLNPKFMSSRTSLPVFFTFVILLVAERLFGTWGLIVGIPIFTFLLDIIGVKKASGSESLVEDLPRPAEDPATEVNAQTENAIATAPESQDVSPESKTPASAKPKTDEKESK